MQLIVYGKNNVPVLTRELPDDRRKMTIGRQDDCAVRLSGDTCVSRHHASICFDGTAVYLEDMGSSGGTAVNGTSLQKGVPTFVRPGDRIQIGSFVMAVAGDANAASAASEPFAGQAQDNPPKAPAPDQSPESEYDPELEQAQEKFKREFGDFSVLYNDKTMKLIEKIHEDVLRKMNWTADSVKMANNQEERAKVEQILDVVLNERGHEIPGSLSKAMLRQTMIDQIFGYGPLSRLLKSPDITEIMINGPDCIFVEYKVKSNKAKCFQTAARFFNEHQLISVIQRIVEPLGRRVDKSSPMVDARLPDGSRVNVIIPPLALQGPSVTIRKFPEHKLTIEDLIQYNSLTREMALFLEEAVKAKKNILVAGGTGSGKTTLLNVLSLFIPAKERVITVEDSAELKLYHRNLVSLEARPANIEGEGRVTIRDLVINTLRMRPDRIIVGECRGSEALDMLQAMNTGHDGSMTTAHANSPRDALARLENMVMMAGFELPLKAIREQIASAIHLIVQQERMSDGSRKIKNITEITGCEGDKITMQDIFTFETTGFDPEKKEVTGFFKAEGNIPKFITDLVNCGKLDRGFINIFVEK